MSLRELMSRERVVRRELAGIGLVNVRRLDTAEVLSHSTERFGTMMVALAILDENQKPLFEKIEQVGKLEWALFQALQEVALEVNGIELPKNPKEDAAESPLAAIPMPG